MKTMKSIKIMGLCLVAVFAFGAIAVASASAKPRHPFFEKCEKAGKVERKYTGDFSNKGCTEAAVEGKYKLTRVSNEAGPYPFTLKGKGATFKFGGKVVKCTKVAGVGAIDPPTWELGPEETVTFSKCDINENKKETCENVTTALTGELYYTSKAETEADVDLSGTFFVFAEIKCGTETFVLKESVIPTIKNSKKGETITFAVNGEGHQAQKEIWDGEEEYGSYNLEYDGQEATLEATLEQNGPKGVGVFF